MFCGVYYRLINLLSLSLSAINSLCIQFSSLSTITKNLVTCAHLRQFLASQPGEDTGVVSPFAALALIAIYSVLVSLMFSDRRSAGKLRARVGQLKAARVPTT